MGRKTVSQKTIAESLNVTQALVSYVLNGRTDRISREIREKILSKAKELGYISKHLSPQPAPVKSNIVGVILRSGLSLSGNSYFFRNILGHVQSDLLDHKTFCSVLGTEDHFNQESLLGFLKVSRLDGIIVLGQISEALLCQIKDITPNIVAISASYPHLCHSVNANEQQATDLLLKHLLDQGHKKFAWIGGQVNLERFKVRKKAFENSMIKFRVKASAVTFTTSDEGAYLDGEFCATKLIKSGKSSSTAWICHNGMMARGAINYALKNGIEIPKDLSVVGLDMTDLATNEHPFITTAFADSKKISSKAVQLLLHHKGDKDTFLNILLPSALEVRESS
jgi:LacI family transcriptional regulator